MWRTEPADARTVFGLKGSTDPSQHTTAPAPAPWATRITAPAFPGSRTSTHTTTKLMPTNWSRVASGIPTTASTG